jgi:hypothetical protein
MSNTFAEIRSGKTRLRKVRHLRREKFFIPFFQRGYKWTKTEVNLLLNDICAHPAEQRYCLQPIVIARRLGSWEVIDGQQRLTTIHLILKFLKHEGFQLEYARKTGDEQNLVEFLPKPNEDKSCLEWQEYINTAPDINNIDNFHIFHAWRTIQEWFSESEPQSRTEFLEKLLNKVTVIWHVVELQNASKEFKNFNDGRISLSPCELLKAILLSSPAIKDTIRSPEEIAFEWDQMESALRNEEFWYFLNPPKSARMAPNRISLLFQMIDSEKSDDASGSAFLRRVTAKQNHSDLAIEWIGVRRCFLTIQEWFDDRELCHTIGFLRWRKKLGKDGDLKSLWDHSQSHDREEFRKHIVKLVKQTFSGDPSFEKLRYGENNEQIQDLLLWFNIQELSCHYRYPFSRHAMVKTWSLEHLYPQNPLEEMEDSRIKGWIDSALVALQKNETNAQLIEPLEAIPRTAKGIAAHSEIINQVADAISYDLKRDTHELANMALIDGRDNSALGNGFFDEKRKRLLEIEQMPDRFIPPSTSKVFLKYYDGDTKIMSEWTPQDRNSYLARISTVMKKTAEMTTI